MKSKLNRLFEEAKKELCSIGIDFNKKEIFGEINIEIAKRKCKRYGCCKQEDPNPKTAYFVKRRKYYRQYFKHTIEISSWLMDLNDEIIKNTIIHELIHCIPDCNNHGKKFKEYAKFINEKLGYNISRLGNKKNDFKKSNLEYNNENINKYKYKVVCTECQFVYYRMRLAKNFVKKYRCGKCRGILKLDINF